MITSSFGHPAVSSRSTRLGGLSDYEDVSVRRAVGVTSTGRRLGTDDRALGLPTGPNPLIVTPGGPGPQGSRDPSIIIVPPREGLSSSVFTAVISPKASSLGVGWVDVLVIVTVHTVSSHVVLGTITRVKPDPTTQVTTLILLSLEDRLHSLDFFFPYVRPMKYWNF